MALNMGIKRILHIIHGLNIGGAENFIYNVLANIDRNLYMFDFAIQNPNIGHVRFKRLIEDSGGEIYIMPDFRNNPIGQVQSLRKILSRGYEVVHIHMNAFVNPLPAIVSRFYPNRVIIHSHNTRNGSGGRLGKLLHLVNSRLFLSKDFIRIGCGPEAGKWMFRKKSFKVLSNAVDIDKFRFDTNRRTLLREKLGIHSGEYVIGHMGRFVPEKNQTFLVDIMAWIKRNRPAEKIKLILCGEGPLRSDVERKVKAMELVESVIFTGAIDNPEDYYSVFDCFVLPSWFEGLAFVAIEAQAAGLPIVASDTNSSSIKLTDPVCFISLQSPIENWVDCIMGYKNIDRYQGYDIIKGSSYNIENLVREIQAIYNG